MRTLSGNAVASINALQTDSAWLYLIEITHPDIVGSYRFVNNTEDVIALGLEWLAYPFRLTLAVDDGQTLPSAEVEFDNVDRALIDVIRGLTSAPTINLYAVMSTTPYTVEMSLTDLQLMDIAYDVQSISGRLVSGDLLNAPYPADSYEPAQFPAIFF
jgi:Domain of unknown function (DUF1833)